MQLFPMILLSPPIKSLEPREEGRLELSTKKKRATTVQVGRAGQGRPLSTFLHSSHCRAIEAEEPNPLSTGKDSVWREGLKKTSAAGIR